MVRRAAASVMLAAYWVLALVACRSPSAPDPYIGPISDHAEFGTRDGGAFVYVLTSSTNCARFDSPMIFTLTITNVSSIIYESSLPVSVLDLRMTELASNPEQVTYWSASVPSDQHFHTLSLPPQQSVTIQWQYRTPPATANNDWSHLAIRPLVRARDPYQNNQIRDEESGSFLSVAVGGTSGLGACPGSHP